MNPKISVVMSVYNGSRFLNQAIDSVLKQSFSNFEFIIVDDASTDSSLEIISDWARKDSRLKIIRNNPNIGLTRSLNKAIKEAKGEYLARIDADDVCYQSRFEKQKTYLDTHQKCAVVGSWADVVDDNNKILRIVRYPTESTDLKNDLMKYNPFFHSSIMIRRSALEEVGLYDENFRFAQDYELYFRITQKYDIANFPEVLIGYRETLNSITSSKNRKQIGFVIKAKLKALRNGQYPKYYYIYLIRNYLAWLFPASFKRGVKRLFHFHF